MSARRRPPAGFMVLGACAALFGGLAALALTVEEGDLLANSLFGAWAALGLVTAEALWGMRRWAFDASVALACCVLAPGLVAAFVAMADGAGADALMALAMVGISGYGVYPVLVYVRDRSRLPHAAGPAAP